MSLASIHVAAIAPILSIRLLQVGRLAVPPESGLKGVIETPSLLARIPSLILLLSLLEGLTIPLIPWTASSHVIESEIGDGVVV